MTPGMLARLQAARAAGQPVALLTRLSDGHQCLWPEDSAPGALAEAAGMSMRCHTLVWHSQVPSWMSGL